MRSLQVSQDFPDEFYPNRGMFVKQAIDAIHRGGVEVEVVSPRARVLPVRGFPNHLFARVPVRERESLRNLGYPIHHPRYIYPVPKRLFYRFAGPGYARSVTPYVTRNVERAHIIHAHFAYPDGYGILPVRQSWGVPLVVHLRGGFIWSTGAAYPQIREKHLRVLNVADRLIAVSRDTRDEYLNLGIPGEKIEVIPNGVDTDRFRTMSRENARAELGLPADRPIILYAGYLIPRKGLQFLMEAIPGLVRDHDPLFLILGEGEMRGELERGIASGGLEANVRLPGRIPHDLMPLYLNAMDCLVLPTQKEGRPNVVMEAMAVERPVVATAVSGIPEVVADGTTGTLVPPRDAGALREALDRILADPELGRRMGRAGAERIRDLDLTWERFAERTVALYRELLER